MDPLPPDACSFNELLPECKNHVLHFLSLKDCLKFTCVSKNSLVVALPQLRERRKTQFYQRYCYQLEKPTLLRRSKIWNPSTEDSSSSSSSSSSSENDEDDVMFSSQVVRKHQWYTIPSVGERIFQLHHSIPSSHPANKELGALKALLVHDEMEIDEGPPEFGKILQQLRDITRAHKLHASILSKATVNCAPKRSERYRYGNDNIDPNSLSITLETYIGDVLVASYLMGNKIAGIIEGGPSFDDWNKHMMSLLRPGAVAKVKALAWYQFWVYLHSTVLRTFPFSVEQAKILLGSCNGILGRTVPQDVNYVHPHYCYLGLEPEQVQTTTKIVRTILLRLATNPDEPIMFTHQTTMTQFGPLGPAFRGRDEIRTRIMNPFSLLHRLHDPSYVLPTTWFLVEQQEHVIMDSRTFHSWFRGTDAVIRWMLELKQECSKSRPMTVMPPVVTVEPVAMTTYLMENTID